MMVCAFSTATVIHGSSIKFTEWLRDLFTLRTSHHSSYSDMAANQALNIPLPYSTSPSSSSSSLLSSSTVRVSDPRIPLSSSEGDDERLQFDVLILGAGIAGLGASLALRDKGLKFAVLEARDRVGGRVWTDAEVFGFPVDFGAAWTHVFWENPLAMLAEQHGIQMMVTNYQKVTFYEPGAQGRPVDDRLVREAYADYSRAFRKLYKDYEAILNEDADIDMKVAVRRALALLPATPSKRDAAEVELKRRVIEFFFYHALVDNNARHLDEMSYKGWYVSDIIDFDSNGGDYTVPGGYMQLIAPEYATVADKIKLRHVVEAVDWTGPSVRVRTSEGTFWARHVIVTLPVPVLAAGRIDFTPPLPIEKRVAIQGIHMGYGTLNKIFLLFERAFWPTQVDFLAHLPHGAITDDELRVFMSLHDFQPGLMCVFLHGRHAAKWEDRSDQECVDRCDPFPPLFEGPGARRKRRARAVTRVDYEIKLAEPAHPLRPELLHVLN